MGLCHGCPTQSRYILDATRSQQLNSRTEVRTWCVAKEGVLSQNAVALQPLTVTPAAPACPAAGVPLQPGTRYALLGQCILQVLCLSPHTAPRPTPPIAWYTGANGVHTASSSNALLM